MNSVYVIADNIISPLGFNTSDNFGNLIQNNTGIRMIENEKIFPAPFYSSLIQSEEINSRFTNINSPEKYTRLEKMMILSITDALQQTSINIKNNDTLLVLSTTKGNIDLLEDHSKEISEERIYLWKLGELIGKYFNSPNEVVVISNACISGVLAIIYAARLIQNSVYKNVIVTGGDIISEFVVSGFQSFHSLSDEPCRPFDAARTGLSLGEGCGTIILSSEKKLVNDNGLISFRGGSISNDANHISGPSRTGDGLFCAIRNTMNEAKNNSLESIDYISAHGTATLYNDESEALAISSAGLEETPVNSLKGYWGHTLGAAGIIESIAAIHSMKKNVLINTFGFEKLGVSKNINVINKTSQTEIRSCLKTASGFGGCNAAIAFSK